MSDTPEERNRRIQNALNQHGFPFQEAVTQALIRAADDRSGGDQSWRFGGREFPVEHRGRDVKIDAILEFQQSAHKRLFLVVEAKRTNPDYSEWVFMRSTSEIRTFVDVFSAHRIGQSPLLSAKASRFLPKLNPVFDTCIDMKKEKAAKGGDNKLDDAIAQVFRGVGGLAELIPELLTSRGEVIIMPLIVTTAPLRIVNESLAMADLETGNLRGVTTSTESLLWLSYNVSASMTPKVEREWDSLDDGTDNLIDKRLGRFHSRTVLIANPSAIPRALEAMEWLGLRRP